MCCIRFLGRRFWCSRRAGCAVSLALKCRPHCKLPSRLCLCAWPQVDLVDLGEGRDPRFRYVLVVVELYTRFVWIYPLPTKHALLVARHVSAGHS